MRLSPSRSTISSGIGNTAANRAAVRGYDLLHTDRVPQRVLDRQLWRAVKGPLSKPPAPGPNAAGPNARDPDG